MVRRLMAAILGLLGRDPRHGGGTWSIGRRSTDPETAQVRAALARLERLDAQARKLASYQHVRLGR